MIELVAEPGKYPTKSPFGSGKRHAAADDEGASAGATHREYARFDPSVALSSTIGWEAQESKRARERARRGKQIEAEEGDHPWSRLFRSLAFHLIAKLLPWVVLIGLFAWKMPRLFHWLVSLLSGGRF